MNTYIKRSVKQDPNYKHKRTSISDLCSKAGWTYKQQKSGQWVLIDKKGNWRFGYDAEDKQWWRLWSDKWFKTGSEFVRGVLWGTITSTQ
jgi:hypothetical protein